MKTHCTKPFLLLLTAVLLLTACAPAVQPAAQAAPAQTAPGAATATSFQDAPAPSDTRANDSPSASTSETVSEAEPLPYDPAATHLPPEQWREWPVVPQLSERGKAIYQRGLAMDSDPQAFSKVGDCQSIKEVLLGMYDQPDNYVLRDSELHLQETIDNFSGSFDRDGMAVKGGFNAASVLSPLWADPETCLPGENPLECEIRVHKPSFVIISLEVWWEGRSVERYEEYMRRIIEYSIDHGAVPILSTKADNVEGDHSINLATARLAYEYDLPLWNFWLAAQALSNRGLDAERNDGFHLSKQAWTERSYTALKTLDAVWRSANAEEDDEAVEAPVLAATEASQTGSGSAATLPEETISPDTLQDLLVSSSEILVFGLAERQGEEYLSPGVFLFDFTSQQFHRLLPEGYDFQDISPDGSAVLVNKSSQLFVLDLNTLQQSVVSDSLHAAPNTLTALWLDANQIALITSGEDGRQVRVAGYANNIVDTPQNWRLITAPADNPLGLVKSGIPGLIVWESGEEGSTGLWATTLDSDAYQPLQAVSRPYFSAAANGYACGSQDSSLMVHTLDGALRRELPLPGNTKWEYTLADAAWSADGQRLALQVLERSNYTGKQFNVTNYILTPANWGIQELGESTSLNSFIRWAPDETSLILAGTAATDEGYAISLSRLALPKKTITSYDEALGITAPDYLFITRLGWLVTTGE